MEQNKSTFLSSIVANPEVEYVSNFIRWEEFIDSLNNGDDGKVVCWIWSGESDESSMTITSQSCKVILNGEEYETAPLMNYFQGYRKNFRKSVYRFVKSHNVFIPGIFDSIILSVGGQQ